MAVDDDCGRCNHLREESSTVAILKDTESSERNLCLAELRNSFGHAYFLFPRQRENGRSAARVQALVKGKSCCCKLEPTCYSKFTIIMAELMKFLSLFWDLAKVVQDAYVPPSKLFDVFWLVF